MSKVALIGYSGHAYVVYEVLYQAGYEIVGYFEKATIQKNPFKLKYLGYERDHNAIKNVVDTAFFPAIGDNYIRRKITEFLLDANYQIANAISPFSSISNLSTIHAGVLVCRGTCINPFAEIRIGVILNTGVIIEHECVISEFAHISPGAVLAGNVFVGQNSWIGANAVIKQEIRIGNNVIVGAGSVVLNDIPDNEIWVGNPAKKIMHTSN